jgi:hypothetical protein
MLGRLLVVSDITDATYVPVEKSLPICVITFFCGMYRDILYRHQRSRLECDCLMTNLDHAKLSPSRLP